MAYMAPEILDKKGYLHTCDWWSLGVLLFECAFGKRPFRGKTNDALINSIQKDPIPLPKTSTDFSDECLKFLGDVSFGWLLMINSSLIMIIIIIFLVA